MLIRKMSPISRQMNEMELNITDDQIKRWQAGGLIQDVMPNLSADEREFLISGITASEWAGMFPKRSEL